MARKNYKVEMPEAYKQIIEAYSAGMSRGKINTEFGYTRYMINSCIAQEGLELRKDYNTSRIDFDAERIKKLCEEGLTVKEMAAACGVSPSTMSKWCHEIGCAPDYVKYKKRLKKKQQEARARQIEKQKKKRCKKFKSCIYGWTGPDFNCDYNGVTGLTRGCPADHCEHYKKGKPGGPKHGKRS